MIQDIAPKKYVNHYEEQSPTAEDWMLVYRDGKVLCRFDNEKIYFPKVKEITQEDQDVTYLFTISDERFFLLKNGLDGELEGYGWEKPVIFRNARPQYRGFAGITGMQLFDWYRSNKFCGRCGKSMVPDHKERMVHCECCGNMVYPKICLGINFFLQNMRLHQDEMQIMHWLQDLRRLVRHWKRPYSGKLWKKLVSKSKIFVIIRASPGPSPLLCSADFSVKWMGIRISRWIQRSLLWENGLTVTTFR